MAMCGWPDGLAGDPSTRVVRVCERGLRPRPGRPCRADPPTPRRLGCGDQLGAVGSALRSPRAREGRQYRRRSRRTSCPHARAREPRSRRDQTFARIEGRLRPAFGSPPADRRNPRCEVECEIYVRVGVRSVLHPSRRRHADEPAGRTTRNELTRRVEGRARCSKRAYENTASKAASANGSSYADATSKLASVTPSTTATSRLSETCLGSRSTPTTPPPAVPRDLAPE